MSVIRVAGLQMPVSSCVADNARIILDGLDQAKDAGAEILLTPEGSLSGYTPNFRQTDVQPAIRDIAGKAAGLRIALALGTCFYEEDGKCYNQVRVYLPDDGLQGFHAKIMLCSRLDAPGTGEMMAYSSSPLRTFAWRGTSFGCLVCNDLWATPGYTTTPNPYLPWQLKKLGANFILHAVNSGDGEQCRAFHESNLALWANALKLPIATVNAAPAQGLPNCHSGIVTPEGQWSTRIEQPGRALFCGELHVSSASAMAC